MRLALLLGLALVACKKDKDPVDSGPTTEPIDCSVTTDTIPSFCGQVPKNVIFISIDTYRKDMLSRYGGDPDWAPTLNRLAEEGFVLDDNIQCSNWTYASTTCTLMGRTNLDAGFIPGLNSSEPIPPGPRFLPGYLADAGYWSVLVSSNAWLSNTWGNGRDYNRVVFPGGGRITGVAQNGIFAVQDAKEAGSAKKWMMHLHGLEPHAAYVPDDQYLGGLADLDPLPAGLDLTNQDNHYSATATWPAMTSEEQDLLKAHLRVRYEGEVRLFDDGLALVMQRLEREGWLDDAMVVIWTDHGEAFWEHGEQTHAHHLFGEENDTLAIFWARNIVPGSWSGPTQSIDLAPTVLGLLDLPIPEEMDGIRLGEAPEDRARFTLAAARQGRVQAVLKDGWRLSQYNWGPLVLTHPGEDPLEPPLDLDENAAKVDELWQLLEPKRTQWQTL